MPNTVVKPPQKPLPAWRKPDTGPLLQGINTAVTGIGNVNTAATNAINSATTPRPARTPFTPLNPSPINPPGSSPGSGSGAMPSPFQQPASPAPPAASPFQLSPQGQLGQWKHNDPYTDPRNIQPQVLSPTPSMQMTDLNTLATPGSGPAALGPNHPIHAAEAEAYSAYKQQLAEQNAQHIANAPAVAADLAGRYRQAFGPTGHSVYSDAMSQAPGGLLNNEQAFGRTGVYRNSPADSKPDIRTTVGGEFGRNPFVVGQSGADILRQAHNGGGSTRAIDDRPNPFQFYGAQAGTVAGKPAWVNGPMAKEGYASAGHLPDSRFVGGAGIGSPAAPNPLGPVSSEQAMKSEAAKARFLQAHPNDLSKAERYGNVGLLTPAERGPLVRAQAQRKNEARNLRMGNLTFEERLAQENPAAYQQRKALEAQNAEGSRRFDAQLKQRGELAKQQSEDNRYRADKVAEAAGLKLNPPPTPAQAAEQAITEASQAPTKEQAAKTVKNLTPAQRKEALDRWDESHGPTINSQIVEPAITALANPDNMSIFNNPIVNPLQIGGLIHRHIAPIFGFGRQPEPARPAIRGKPVQGPVRSR